MSVRHSVCPSVCRSIHAAPPESKHSHEDADDALRRTPWPETGPDAVVLDDAPDVAVVQPALEECELERDRSRVFSVFRENARRELDVGAVASADGRHAWLTDADAASHDCPAQLHYPPVKFLSRPQPRLRDILWRTLPLRREAQRESRRVSRHAAIRRRSLVLISFSAASDAWARCKQSSSSRVSKTLWLSAGPPRARSHSGGAPSATKTTVLYATPPSLD